MNKDITIINNVLAYPFNQMAGQLLAYECFISKEMYSDHLEKVKGTLVKKIHGEFNFRNKNNSIKLSDKVEYEVLPIKSDGCDYRVTAIIETIFI